MSDAVLSPPPRVRAFFGQPIGLAYLAFTEAWERFSFYGMTALLLLYMSKQLFNPEHVQHVVGFAAFRAALEAVFGPMSAGHLAMAFDASFLLALLLLVLGSGLLKGNISIQVGALYREDDATGRTRGFAIFSIAINVGAVAGPLLCGELSDKYGWHAGFGLAGILMLAGLVTYLLGYRTISEEMRGATPKEAPQPLDARAWRIVAALAAVMALTIFQSIAYYQNGDIAMSWIDGNVDLMPLGFHVPVAWFNSVDSFASIVFVPVLFALWRRQARRGGEPGEIAKIATGAFLACAANLLLVAGSALAPHVPVLVPVVYDVLLGIGFLYYWPTLLALVSRVAPQRLKATLMGCAFLSLAVANMAIGRIGALYEHMSPAAFWGLHAAVAAAGGVLALLLIRPLGRVLESGHG